MSSFPTLLRLYSVTLHTEGVDRNTFWTDKTTSAEVTLHTEGVDRNFALNALGLCGQRHPPHGGCG